MILLSQILAWIHLVVGSCAVLIGATGKLANSEFVSAVVAIFVAVCLFRGIKAQQQLKEYERNN